MRIILHSNRRKHPSKASIEFEVYFNRTDRVYISTSVNLDLKYWDDKAKQVKYTHPEFDILNRQINAIRERINVIGTKYIQRHDQLTGPLLKIELQNYNVWLSVNEYVKEQIEIDKPSVKYSTYKRLRSFLNTLNRFRTFTFNQCDTALIRLYHNHLLTTMQSTSTSKDHKALSKYLHRAVVDKLLESNPYENFQIPGNTKRKVYLSEDELVKLRDKEISIERINIVRNKFLFLCNTGMEFTDQDNLMMEDITTIKGKKYIVKDRMKVEGEIQAIPLFKEALDIIKLYNKSGTGRIFPRLSNQNYNAYLKELADICGIEKNLTTIVARHTFATLMLTKGMPLESVSHILGHSNIKTTRVYAKLIVTKIENDLDRLNIEGL